MNVSIIIPTYNRLPILEKCLFALENQERNRAYARKFKKRKLRTDGRPDGGNVTGTANNGGAAD